MTIDDPCRPAVGAARPPDRRSRRLGRALVLIFFFSGASSLVYQVVWQRLLTVHYGVGSLSITLIVSVYMLGLGLGALAGGRLAERRPSVLLTYCVVELTIAVFGASSLPLLDMMGRFTAGTSHAVAWLSMFGFLLVPTLAMGATLPLLVKAFNRVARDFLRSVSLLYFVNTLGAAVGTLATAYGLITFGGLDVALAVAVAINLLLAVAVYVLGRGPRGADGAEATRHRPAVAMPPARPWSGSRVYPLVFVSGFLAIGYEIVWFRLIGVLNKASPYAFATSLSVYLLGIALGSYGVERLLRRHPRLSRIGLFFTLQVATGLSVLVLVAGFERLAASGPLARLARTSFAQILHPPSWQATDLLSVFTWPLYFELFPTLLIGAGFPLLASLALSRSDREGATVGRVYFANTLGNLAGGVVCGLVLLGTLGSERTLQCFAATNIVLLLLAPRRWWAPLPRVTFVAATLVVVGLSFPAPGRIYGTLHRPPGPGFDLYLEEGVDGVVATFEKGPVVVNYINGLEHGGRPWAPFAVETMEALAIAPDVENVLIIGFGTGTITEIVLRSAEVERVTLVELNRALIRNLRKMEVFRRILADPRLEIVYDDGRRHLLRVEEDYDLVLMDPLRATTAYSNNLYSLEFFRLVSRRLDECGVFMAWTDDPVVVPRTVAVAFPQVAFYELPGNESFMLGGTCRLRRHPERIEALLAAAPAGERALLGRWMRELRPRLDRAGLLAATAGGRVNRDRRPASEYYLGLD